MAKSPIFMTTSPAEFMRPGRHDTDYDEIEDEIERILRDQKTHELMCPVCDSCITKRLIIRKRKRPNSTEEPHRLAKARRNSEDALTRLIDPREEVHGECKQVHPSSPPITTVIIDVDSDPEDDDCFGCLSFLSCFSFCDKGPGKLTRQRSMRNPAEYGPDESTPLLRNHAHNLS